MNVRLLCLLYVVEAAVSETGWSPVQKSPTWCVYVSLILCDLETSKRVALGPSGAVTPQKNIPRHTCGSLFLDTQEALWISIRILVFTTHLWYPFFLLQHTGIRTEIKVYRNNTHIWQCCNLHGLIQNFPDWCRHLYNSCGSAKHR